MAMPTLTPEQREKAAWGTSTITSSIAGKTKEAKVTARVGVLEHFGFTPDVSGLDLFQKGIDRDITRSSHRRSRHLGDFIKTGVSGTNFKASFYPSRRGVALTGEPIELENVISKERWQVQLLGPIEVLIAWLDKSPGDFNIKLWGKTGNRYLGEIVRLNAQAAAAAQSAGGSSATAPGTAQPVPAALPMTHPPQVP